jgi:hypothetical protein
MMTSRERVEKALNHQQPDKVPLDLGATPVSSISAATLDKLRKALKLEVRPVKIQEPLQLLGSVENDVVDALGVDIVGLWSPSTFFDYKNTDWKPWQLFDGTEVLVGGGFTVTQDAKGDSYLYPGGDTSVQPSGKLPKGGYYFDNLFRQEAVDYDNLNAKEDFRGDFSLFTDEQLRHYENTVNKLYTETDYAIIGVYGGASLGDLAFLPGPGLKRTPGIRNIEDWYAAHYANPEYINDVYDLQVEIALKNLHLYKQAVGDKIQAIVVSGTDFGTQRGEYISPQMFRDIYKPQFKKVNDWIHANTNWKTFYHSCGSIVNLLDDMVEIGVDIINPVQCSAEGMDPQFLKDKYRGKLVFWGGGIDTQKTLPFGTPEEVRAETLERLKIFSENGGYIFNPVHCIQYGVPVDNLLTAADTAYHFKL